VTFERGTLCCILESAIGSRIHGYTGKVAWTGVERWPGEGGIRHHIRRRFLRGGSDMITRFDAGWAWVSQVLIALSFLVVLSACPAEEEKDAAGPGLRVGKPAPPVAVRAVVPLAEAVAAIEKSPKAALALVRDHVSWRPYAGFVKGPRATWWDGTGNAADTAELLQEVLRQLGISSRLAFGTPPAERVTALLEATYAPGEVPEEVAKELLPGEVADPARDPRIRSLATRHVWVQARWEDAWLDLDPVTPGARVGDAPEKVIRTKPVVSLAERRKLRVEILTLMKGQPRHRRLLHIEEAVSNLVGRRIVVTSKGVDPESRNRRLAPGRLCPVILAGDRAVAAKKTYDQRPVEDAANPAGRLGGLFGRPGVAPDKAQTAALEEVVLELTLFSGGQPVRRQRRYLYVKGEGGIDRLSDLNVYVVAFGAPPAAVLRKTAEGAVGGTKDAEPADAPTKGDLTAEQQKSIEARFAQALDGLTAAAQALAASSHRLLLDLDATYGTVSGYPDARLLGVCVDASGTRFATDLVFDSVVTHARTGVNLSAVPAHAAVRGRLEGDLEGSVLAEICPDAEVLTVRKILLAATAADIDFVALAREKKDGLQVLSLPPLVTRIIAERLAAGRIVIVPVEPVKTPGREEGACAWYEIDRQTGEWVAVLGDGRHSAYAEARALKAQLSIATTYVGAFHAGWDSAMLGYVGMVLKMISAETDQDWSKIRAAAIASAGEGDEIATLISRILIAIDVLSVDIPEAVPFIVMGSEVGCARGQQAGVIFLKLFVPD